MAQTSSPVGTPCSTRSSRASRSASRCRCGASPLCRYCRLPFLARALLACSLQLDAPSAAQLHAVFAAQLPLAGREAGRKHAAVAHDAAAASAAASLAPTNLAPLAGAKRKKTAATVASAEEARAAAAASTVAGAGSGPSSGKVSVGESHCVVEGVIVPLGPLPQVDRAATEGDADRASYVLVHSIRRHLHNLARAVSTGARYPVLLQVRPCFSDDRYRFASVLYELVCRARRQVARRALSSTWRH